jgi:outer membrane protein assembly factor BamD
MRLPVHSGVITLALAVLLGLAGCGGKDKEVYVEKPVDELYNSGLDQLLAGQFVAASKQFEEVERQHPYSSWATKAKVMSAYALYEEAKYDDAILQLDRFLQQHPGAKDAPYAQYLRALCYYEQIVDVERDQKITDRAMRALEEIIKRYPNSEYARDAQLKFDLTRDHLAGKEMSIGRYYLRGGHYGAAINRFLKVINEYQTTSHVAEALHRLVESYSALGVKQEARKYGAVLGHNFPGSDWYADSYYLLEGVDLRERGNRPGWINRTWSSIF